MTAAVEIQVVGGHGAPVAGDFPSGTRGAVYVDLDTGRIYSTTAGTSSDPQSTLIINRTVLAVAAGSDSTANCCVVPWAGVVSSVKFVAQATLTGANTDSRTLSLINVGAEGAGSTSVASKAFLDTVNATAAVPCTITNSVTAADLVVAAGDVLQWSSAHVGGTGLADPGGLVVITLTRS